MKKCNSRRVKLFVLFSSIFLLSQIKLSSISKLLSGISTTNDQGQQFSPHGASRLGSPISCDRSHKNYAICSINGPTVLDPTQSTFYVVGPTRPTPQVEKVRPYPQKNSSFTRKMVKEVTLTSGPPSPPCTVKHKARALVFSVGGFTGNFFHTFIDAFIPLFITVNSISTDNQGFVFVIADYQDWWVRRYMDLFRSLSKHPIINLDNDTSTHCFPSATVGLISHGFMTIDPTRIPNSRTPADFHSLLEQAFCPGKKPSIPAAVNRRPRLLLMGRSGGGGRVILNKDEMVEAAEEEGFEVVEFEPDHRTPMSEACELVGSSQAMMGVHGAALTYTLFLRRGAVVVQVVGIGLGKVAEMCFGAAAREMGLEYMEYKIGLEESSLVDRYGKDDVIVKDPESLQEEWSDQIMEVYLRQQNVKLDLVRFRGYLKRAYEKAKIALVKWG